MNHLTALLTLGHREFTSITTVGDCTFYVGINPDTARLVITNEIGEAWHTDCTPRGARAVLTILVVRDLINLVPTGDSGSGHGLAWLYTLANPVLEGCPPELRPIP